MLVIVVIVLVFTVLALGIYNLSLYKRIQSFQTQNRRFTNLNIAFGGTSILIVVGVALETIQQLESQLAMRHYKGFLE